MKGRPKTGALPAAIETMHYLYKCAECGRIWHSNYDGKGSAIFCERDGGACTQSVNPNWKDRRGYVYCLKSPSGLVKIGKTRQVDQRIYALTHGMPDWELLSVMECDNAAQAEANKHRFWSDFRVAGEWFQMPDYWLEAMRTMKGYVCHLTDQYDDIAERENW
jgi:hypothetical protein